MATEFSDYGDFHVAGDKNIQIDVMTHSNPWSLNGARPAPSLPPADMQAGLAVLACFLLGLQKYHIWLTDPPAPSWVCRHLGNLSWQVWLVVMVTLRLPVVICHCSSLDVAATSFLQRIVERGEQFFLLK